MLRLDRPSMLCSSVITRNITQQTKHDILNSYSSEQGKQKVIESLECRRFERGSTTH